MATSDPSALTIWNAEITVRPALGGQWEGEATWETGQTVLLGGLYGRTADEAITDARRALTDLLPTFAPFMAVMGEIAGKEERCDAL